MIYEQISEITSGPVKYHLAKNGSMRMLGTKTPWCITENEFDYISQFLICKNAKSCFEIGTGFGVSLLSLGTAMKYTGGLAISMDCYKEETGKQRQEDRTIYKDSLGFKSATFLIDHFGLSDYAKPVFGFSPIDVDNVIREHFEETVDCVFIDGFHNSYSISKDFGAVAPFLSDTATVFFHDSQYLDCFLVETIEQAMGARIVACPTVGFNLTQVSK